MLVLALETSCDDTCAAVLHDRGDRVELLSNLVSSQGIHAEYEGIVPELASREHLRLLGPILRRALKVAGVAMSELDAVAVTSGPGRPARAWVASFRVVCRHSGSAFQARRSGEPNPLVNSTPSLRTMTLRRSSEKLTSIWRSVVWDGVM